MRIMCWVIVPVGISQFILSLFTYLIPEFLCVLLSFSLLITLVLLLIVASCLGFIVWRKASRLWMVPALVCLAFILCEFFLVSSMAQHISDPIFERHLSEYSKVVDGLRSGTISCATPCVGERGVIEATIRPAHVRDIWAVRCDDGGLLVLFRVDTDVPLLHEGYLFKGYGERSNCNTGREMPERRLYVRHITGSWYRFSDQPGF